MPVGKTQSKALSRSVLTKQQLLAQIINIADLSAANGQAGERCLKNYGRGRLLKRGHDASEGVCCRNFQKYTVPSNA